jgi:serine/threonine-protein kinase
VPAPLEAICLKAMAKLPDNRYQTAIEMHDDLERFRNGQPVQAIPLLASAATTQAIPRGDGDQTAMMSGVPADRATRYAEPYEEEERRTSVGWIVVSLLALLVVGLAAFFITQALTRNDNPTLTTAPPSTVAQTTATTEAPATTEKQTTATTQEQTTATTEKQTTATTEKQTTATTEEQTTSEPTTETS